MRNITLGTVLAVAIAACGGCQPQPVDVEALVKADAVARLKDPESAQFRNVRTVHGIVCGELNAKNSFGGYVGFEPFYGRVAENGKAEAFSASANPFGSHFEEVLEAACRDRSPMSPAEQSADLGRRLRENGEDLKRLGAELD